MSKAEYRDTVPKLEPISSRNSALVVIDLTNFDAHPDHGFARVLGGAGVDLSYYWHRLETVVMPNVKTLLQAYRDQHGRIAFTRVGAQFEDYGDSLVHLRELHRRTGSLRGTTEFEVRSEILPRRGEVVVDKPGVSAFTTGNLDVILRNAGVRALVFTGVVTNGCVLASALSAWDLGYSVYLVEDACAAPDEEIHDAALRVARWQGLATITTADVLKQLPQTAQSTRVTDLASTGKA